MLGTLGLAVVGFVVTLGAQDDKILIVRDGSVDVFLNNSNLEERDDSTRTHKWSKGADLVQVLEGPTAAAACTTLPALNQPTKFTEVTMTLADRTNNNESLTIIAANSGPFFKRRLKLRMEREWRFLFRGYGHRLVYGNPKQPEERDVKLQQVAITLPGVATPTKYPSTPSRETFLCVKFIHGHED
jgi:hypothetical protein